MWTPHDPKKVVPADKWLPISWEHPFGTDGAGRDLLSQVLVGARTTLLVALLTVAIAAVIGLTLGVLSAITPRVVGESIAHLIDVLIALPTLILALVFVAALGGLGVDGVAGPRRRLRRRAGARRAGRGRRAC